MILWKEFIPTFGLRPWLSALARGQNHHHLAALKFGLCLNLGGVHGVFLHALKQFHAQFLVRHFTATEAQGDLDLVAIVKKACHRLHLHAVVMNINIRSHLDFFDFNCLLLFSCLRCFFLILIFQLAQINDLAYRRLSIRHDLNKVKPRFLSKGQSFIC